MKKFEIYFSLENDKNQNKIEPAQQEKLKKEIINKAIDLFEGVSIVDSIGGYIYNNGNRVIEKSYILILFSEYNFGVVSLSKFIKEIAKQESVLYTETELKEVKFL